MRQWAYLACRVIGLACGVIGSQQFLAFLIMRIAAKDASYDQMWTLLSISSPSFFLASGILIYWGAGTISRMLVPESMDKTLAPPSATPREVAIVGWSIIGVFGVARSLPFLVYYGALWFWSKAGTMPLEWKTAFDDWPSYVPWYSAEFLVGAIVFVLAASRLERKNES